MCGNFRNNILIMKVNEMAVMQQQKRLMTAEEFAAPGMPEKFVELIDGELIEISPAGPYHNLIALEFAVLFRAFCKTQENLFYGGDNDGFVVTRNPDSIASPDASLFRRRDRGKGPWMPFAPEIVVEVLSPSNSGPEMVYRRKRYFDAGTEQFWLVIPEERKILFHFRDGRVIIASGDEVITAEGIAEGLQVDLKAIFDQDV